MKNIKKIRQQESQLNPSEIADLGWIIEELTHIKDSATVNEEGLLKLENINTNFINIKRTYAQRVIKLLKQGHMLD
jgi:hypothetical protein